MAILVFLGLSVLELFPMYATDRRQTKASLNAPPTGGGIITITITGGEVLQSAGQTPTTYSGYSVRFVYYLIVAKPYIHDCGSDPTASCMEACIRKRWEIYLLECIRRPAGEERDCSNVLRCNLNVNLYVWSSSKLLMRRRRLRRVH